MDRTSNSQLRRLAELLIDARSSGTALESVPEDLVPSSVEDAQRVDDLVAEITEWPVLGWKIGCTSVYAQELLGSDGPFAGRIYKVLDSGVQLGPADIPAEGMLEGEFAFTIGAALTADGTPASRSQVMSAVANVRPAIEVVGGRYATFVGLDLRLIIADAGANGLLVVGPEIEGADLEQLGSTRAQMVVDDAQTGSGSGADVLGHPIDALHWLTTHLAGRGFDLSVGQVVTTGTATQVCSLPAGSSATASFDGLGSVSLSRD